MLKVAVSVISNMNVQWVKVLGNKYGVISRWSSSIHPSNCSFLLKALSNIWEDVANGVYWELGNGRAVKLKQIPTALTTRDDGFKGS
ncbi:hypothetical protein J1N35_023895 [Gossypium stocksii]|uniref:Uncharacterized protein n=1 Tax=Gossypium stocksii TaxID=47602 RepID=A0A9D3VKH5_9ROSI|nr:hypothetical protein J1N35_023895 [Gossypium stocksii]